MDWDVIAATGKLARVSPGEQAFAFMNAVYRDYKNGASEEVMRQWLRFMLSAPFCFRVIESDDEAHKVMLQLRQDVKADKVGLAHTLLQSIYDVISFKERKPRWSLETTC